MFWFTSLCDTDSHYLHCLCSVQQYNNFALLISQISLIIQFTLCCIFDYSILYIMVKKMRSVTENNGKIDGMKLVKMFYFIY